MYGILSHQTCKQNKLEEREDILHERILTDAGWPHLKPCALSLYPSINAILRQGNTWQSEVLSEVLHLRPWIYVPKLKWSSTICMVYTSKIRYKKWFGSFNCQKAQYELGVWFSLK